MSTDANKLFNNQISNELDTYFKTTELKKRIATQLQNKTQKEQEAVIETLLKLLDVNLLAALQMSYGIASKDEASQWEHKAYKIIILHTPVGNILVEREDEKTPISTLEAEGYEMISVIHDQFHNTDTGIFKRLVQPAEERKA